MINIPPKVHTGSAIIPNVIITHNGETLNGININENDSVPEGYEFGFVCYNNIVSSNNAIAYIYVP